MNWEILDVPKFLVSHRVLYQHTMQAGGYYCGMLYLPLNAYVSETSVCLCGLLQLQFSLIPSPVFSQLASFCGC